MKKTDQKMIFGFLCMVTIALVSCSKNNQDILPVIKTALPPASNLIKTQKSASAESVYEYDNSGRTKKITTNGITEYASSYNADSLIQTRYFANGAVMETYHIKLSKIGLVETYFNDKYPSITIKYEYNADKTMSKQTNYNYGILASITYYFYDNGNLIKDSTANDGAGMSWHGRLYEYYTNVYSTLENINRGQSHWGAGSKNALKKVTYTNKGVATGTQDYQVPELDEFSRISKTGMTTNNTGAPAIYNYTYY